MNWLWPIRTGKTFIDVWSLIHLAFWFTASGIMRARGVRGWLLWTVAIGGAYAWEVIEKFYFEPHGWVRFPESALNRWLSDPLMAVLATLLAWYLLKGK
jgi:hypothetical protein